MNFQKIAVLTGLSVAGVLASGAFSAAHAVGLIKYTLSGGSGILSDGSSLSGDFSYDAGTNTYSSVNLSVSGGTLPAFTYTYLSSGNAGNNSTLAGVSGATALRLNQAPAFRVAPYQNFRYLSLAFANSLATVQNAGQTTSLLLADPSDGYTTPSNEGAGGPSSSFFRGVTGTITLTATPVPFETDVLPLMGATIAFGAGAVAKRKIAQAKSKKINFEPVKSEELSKVG